MANKNDSAIISEMMALPESQMPGFFRLNSNMIIDDATYWNVLGTLWKLAGTVIQQDIWLAMFESKRKRRHKIMKTKERRMWRKLPKSVVAFRAANCLKEADTAISWTLSKTIAEKVFSEKGNRIIIQKTFDKKQIFAFFDRRKESEILVFQHTD